MEAKPLSKKIDVAGAKMLKAFHFIESNLTDCEFKVIESDMLWDGQNNSLFYYALQNLKLPETVELYGPPLKIVKHAEIFRKKHKKTFVRNNRLFAVEKRKFIDAKILINKMLKSQNVKDNVISIKII